MRLLELCDMLVPSLSSTVLTDILFVSFHDMMISALRLARLPRTTRMDLSIPYRYITA